MPGMIRNRAPARAAIRSVACAAGAAAAALITTPPPAALGQLQYSIQDLGSLGGATSQAYDINNAGRVAGFSVDASGADRAFVTAPGSPINPATDALGVLTGGTYSYAYSINSAGNVVGDGDTLLGDRAYRYSGGVMSSLGSLGGDWSYAYGINESNQVVGGSADVPGPFAFTHAYLYSGTRMTDLGTLGPEANGFNSWARAINSGGAVVGYSQYDPVSYWFNHAFVWTPTSPNATTGSMTDLGTLGGSESYAWSINDRNQIVGAANTAGDLEYHAVRWWKGAKIDLGTLGATYGEAFDVNRVGEVVGASDVTQGAPHAFVFADGAMYDLNSLIPAGSGWMLKSARAINDSGQIVGYGINAQGQTRAFLLTPTSRGSYWNADADGSWSAAADWLGPVPGGVGAAAEFGNAITAPRTVSVDQPTTVGAITFDNPFAAYTLAAGGGTLVLDGGPDAQAARIAVVTGSHTIAAPVSVQQNLEVRALAPASVLTVSGDVSFAPGTGITKTGAGSARFKNLRADAVSVNEGSIAILAGRSTAGTSNVKSLSIAGAPDAWTASIDLNDQDLIVDYSGESVLPTIQNQLKSGFAGGAWTGNGIRSSAAAAQAGAAHRTALGYAEASAVLALSGGTATFSGQTVDSTAVLVRYTDTGDANLDGKVDTLDFNIVAANFGGTGKVWSQADFNYDGVVDTLDFNAMASNFGEQVLAGDSRGVAGTALVPEPATWALLPAFSMVYPVISRRRVRRRRRAA